MTPEERARVLREFCDRMLRQYDRSVATGQHNFGSVLCIVQPWEAEKIRVALDKE